MHRDRHGTPEGAWHRGFLAILAAGLPLLAGCSSHEISDPARFDMILYDRNPRFEPVPLLKVYLGSGEMFVFDEAYVRRERQARKAKKPKVIPVEPASTDTNEEGKK